MKENSNEIRSFEKKEKNTAKLLLKKTMVVTTFSMLVSILGMMIDGMIIGRFLGADRTAAYGMVSPILIVASLLGGLLSSGAITYISQQMAKGEREAVNRLFSVVVFTALLTSAVFIMIVCCFMDPISRFLGASGDAAYLTGYMEAYIMGLLPAIPLLLIMEFVNRTVQLDGNKKLPMMGTIAMLIVDVALDLANVYVFQWDMMGMALATTISYYVSLLIILSYFFRKNCSIRLVFHDLPWNRIGSVLIKGLPSATSRLMATLRALCLNKILIAVAGSMAVAAFSVNTSVGNIMNAIGNGVAGACMMIAGFFIADRDSRSLKQLLESSLKYAFFLSCAVSAVFFLFSNNVAHIFLAGDPETMAEAARVIRYYAVFVPGFAVGSVYYSYLQGLQNVRYSSIICALSTGGLVIICAFILAPIKGAVGVWMSFPLSALLTLAVIWAAAWIHCGHMPKTFQDFAFIPEKLELPAENYIEASVADLAQTVAFSEKVRIFCLSKSEDDQKAHRCALCVEEILKNTFTYGCEKIASPQIDIRVLYSEDRTFTIRIRDNCNPFNPQDYFTSNAETDGTLHMGIRAVLTNAKKIHYTSVMKLNQLTVIY